MGWIGGKPPGGTPLAVVHQNIVSCSRCPRLRHYCQEIARTKRRAFRDDVYWARPVPGFGDPRARLLLVGLAPAAHGANRTGRVFTDDGLTLRDAFIAAAVRCAPPGNKPATDEIANCLPHLDAEIAALPNVRIVV